VQEDEARGLMTPIPVARDPLHWLPPTGSRAPSRALRDHRLPRPGAVEGRVLFGRDAPERHAGRSVRLNLDQLGIPATAPVDVRFAATVRGGAYRTGSIGAKNDGQDASGALRLRFRGEGWCWSRRPLSLGVVERSCSARISSLARFVLPHFFRLNFPSADAICRPPRLASVIFLFICAMS